MKILDCTFRDGGYKTNWHFAADYVREYFDFINKSGIKNIEIGLRLLKKNDSYGEFAYCTDKFIESLNIPEGLQVAVMVKADELLVSDSLQNDINKLFLSSNLSRIDMVRIAVPYKNALDCLEIINLLKDKGYKTSLNLTKLNPNCENELSDIAKQLQSWDSLDILYFADSFGELNPENVKNLYVAIKQHFKREIGFHGHNNHGLAYKNSMVAIECGVDYIDSTFQGIGKGAGNLKTEDVV